MPDPAASMSSVMNKKRQKELIIALGILAGIAVLLSLVAMLG